MSTEKNNIKEAIFNHLKMKTNGALMLTGNWGSGKTYFLKNEIFPAIENETEFVPIMVSLYGESNKTNIAQKVLFAYFDSKGKNSNLSTGTLVKNIKNLADALPKLKEFVDVEKIITGTGDNLFRLIPHQKLLIVFDDLERMSNEIEINDFLGLINDLVENKGCKILLVANKKEIERKITYEEKTIEKTIYFFPEMKKIFDSIINSYNKNAFQKYLQENKEFILKTLDPTVDKEEDQEQLEKSFTNIRTIKFAIEHFKQCFELVSESTDELDRVKLNQLRNLWVFILSISIEYKKPDNITFDDRKSLESQTSAFANIDLTLFDIPHDDSNGQEENKDWKYSENFIRLYYSRISENYIFHPTVYDFITAGKSISKDEFLKSLEESFNVVEGEIDPAHDLLNKFSVGYWNFSNEEFKGKLQDLLAYVEQGELHDIVSFLNAGIFLNNFSMILGLSLEEIQTGMKEGIEEFISSDKVNAKMKREFKMVFPQFSKSEFRPVVEFVAQKLKEIENATERIEVERLIKLFTEDLNLFIEDFLPEDSDIKIPSRPIFHHLKKSVNTELIEKWEPKSIKEFAYLLDQRYIKNGFSDRLKEEIIFIEALEEEIKKLNLDEPVLSFHIIKKDLLPVLEQSKIRLRG